MKKSKTPYICVNELERIALNIILEHKRNDSIIKKSLLLYEDRLIEIPEDFCGNYFVFHFYINVPKYEVSLTLAEVELPFINEEQLNNIYRLTLRGLPKNHPDIFTLLVEMNEQNSRFNSGKYDN